MDSGEIESKAEKWAEKAHKRLSELSTRPPEERNYLAHAFVASAAEYAAVYTLLSGETADAADWFTTAAEQHKADVNKRPNENPDELGDIRNSPAPFYRGQYFAVVGGALQLAEELATEALELERTFPFIIEHTGEEVNAEIDAGRYYHMRAVAGLVLDQSGVVAESVPEVAAAAEESDEQFDRPARQCIETRIVDAILSGDTSQVRAELRDLLELHKVGIRDASTLRPREAICLEAMGLIILARSHGLGVAIESRFVPSEYVSFVLDRRL